MGAANCCKKPDGVVIEEIKYTPEEKEDIDNDQINEIDKGGFPEDTEQVYRDNQNDEEPEDDVPKDGNESNHNLYNQEEGYLKVGGAYEVPINVRAQKNSEQEEVEGQGRDEGEAEGEEHAEDMGEEQANAEGEGEEQVENEVEEHSENEAKEQVENQVEEHAENEGEEQAENEGEEQIEADGEEPVDNEVQEEEHAEQEVEGEEKGYKKDQMASAQQYESNQLNQNQYSQEENDGKQYNVNINQNINLTSQENQEGEQANYNKYAQIIENKQDNVLNIQSSGANISNLQPEVNNYNIQQNNFGIDLNSIGLDARVNSQANIYGINASTLRPNASESNILNRQELRPLQANDININKYFNQGANISQSKENLDNIANVASVTKITKNTFNKSYSQVFQLPKDNLKYFGKEDVLNVKPANEKEDLNKYFQISEKQTSGNINPTQLASNAFEYSNKSDGSSDINKFKQVTKTTENIDMKDLPETLGSSDINKFSQKVTKTTEKIEMKDLPETFGSSNINKIQQITKTTEKIDMVHLILINLNK